MAIIRTVSEWQRRASDYPAVEPTKSVLMAAADFFDVKEAHNNHMRDENGELRKVDKQAAMQEWQQLHDSFANNGLNVEVLPAISGMHDLVFTANPSFIVPHYRHAWPTNMAHLSRRAEAEVHQQFFAEQGFKIKNLSATDIKFEGHGDGLWHPQRLLLHAAVGQRSDLRGWQEIDDAYPELDILLYELRHEDFYHLDTALACLDEQTALFISEAFDDDGLELINAAFPKALALSDFEAYQFAGNAFCADSHNVFIEQGCDALYEKLTVRGFKVHPVATQQFRLSGGSVFCLKQAY